MSGQSKCALPHDLQWIDFTVPVVCGHLLFSNWPTWWAQLEGVEPLASPDDCLLAEQIAKADPKVREMLKMRGVTDMDLVACDPWSGIHRASQILSGPSAVPPACLPVSLSLCLTLCLSLDLSARPLVYLRTLYF